MAALENKYSYYYYLKLKEQLEIRVNRSPIAAVVHSLRCELTLMWAPLSMGWIFQARTLEWVAISFSRGSYPLRNRIHIIILQADFYHKNFPGGSAGKEFSYKAGELGSIPGLGRSPGEGKGYPLQYSGLENCMDCIVHGVTQSWT